MLELLVNDQRKIWGLKRYKGKDTKDTKNTKVLEQRRSTRVSGDSDRSKYKIENMTQTKK